MCGTSGKKQLEEYTRERKERICEESNNEYKEKVEWWEDKKLGYYLFST